MKIRWMVWVLLFALFMVFVSGGSSSSENSEQTWQGIDLDGDNSQNSGSNSADSGSGGSWDIDGGTAWDIFKEGSVFECTLDQLNLPKLQPGYRGDKASRLARLTGL
ncbi:hypothetical protein HOLleu_33330 [Holothuria leucospilota]|uniref:Secreted protein n=1 Tax=Holothuria leucospilota TaxID=206669 RepID=A0A9Q0YNI7_HOLLE|nr:hypothetical protein HOLleu_33330 [Holothuria leucospilota]